MVPLWRQHPRLALPAEPSAATAEKAAPDARLAAALAALLVLAWQKEPPLLAQVGALERQRTLLLRWFLNTV